MKKLIILIAILALTNCKAYSQKLRKVETYKIFIGRDEKPILTLKPNGELFVSDSLKAIQMLSKMLMDKNKEIDLLSRSIYNDIKSRHSKEITIPKKQRS